MLRVEAADLVTRDSQVLARDRFAQVDETLRSNNAEDAGPGVLYKKKFLSSEYIYALGSNRVNFEYLIVCENTRLFICNYVSMLCEPQEILST